MRLMQCVRLRQCVRFSQQYSLTPHSFFVLPCVQQMNSLHCLSVQQVRKFYCSRVKCSAEGTDPIIKQSGAQSGTDPIIKQSGAQSGTDPIIKQRGAQSGAQSDVQSGAQSGAQSVKTLRVIEKWKSWGRTKKVLFWVVIGVFGAFYTLLLVYLYFRSAAIKENDRIMRTEGRSYGKIAIGGPFDLIDTEGNSVTSESLKGNWVLLYFGFTMCPDVCPEQMEMMGDLVDLAEEKLGLELLPVMITIDCDRDTPEMIKEYLEDFHPKFIGLTGTEEQIEPPCLAYRVYRSKGQPLDNNANDYILDHTVTQYLLDPNGETVGFFLRSSDRPERVDKLEKCVNLYNKSNPSNSKT